MNVTVLPGKVCCEPFGDSTMLCAALIVTASTIVSADEGVTGDCARKVKLVVPGVALPELMVGTVTTAQSSLLAPAAIGPVLVITVPNDAQVPAPPSL